MKNWLKKVLHGCRWEQIRDIIIGIVVMITSIPGALLLVIGVFTDNFSFKQSSMICMGITSATLLIYCIFVKDKKGILACSIILSYILYILLVVFSL